MLVPILDPATVWSNGLNTSPYTKGNFQLEQVVTGWRAKYSVLDLQRLSREFDLSERQAYRYLEEASELDRPLELTQATVPITLKLPPSTVERLRKYARTSGLTIGAIVTVALNVFLRTLKRNG
jgi:hypothetical protein